MFIEINIKITMFIWNVPRNYRKIINNSIKCKLTLILQLYLQYIKYSRSYIQLLSMQLQFRSKKSHKINK